MTTHLTSKDIGLLLRVTRKEFNPSTLKYIITFENGAIHEIAAMDEIGVGDVVKVFEDVLHQHNANESSVSVGVVTRKKSMGNQFENQRRKERYL